MYRMLHIVMTTDVYHPFMSGVTRVVDVLIKELLRYNIKVTLFAPTPQRNALKIERDRGITKFYLKSFPLLGLYRDLRPPEIFSAYISTKKCVKQVFIDGDDVVIHAHTPYVTTTLLRWIGRRIKTKIPIILTHHTLVNIYIQQRFGKGGKILENLDKVFLTNVLKRSDIVITLSEYAKKILIEYLPPSFRVLAKKMMKIPNPLPREKYKFPSKRASEYYDFLEDEYYAIFVGRISHEKNIPYLLKIFKRLPYKIVFAGKGPLLEKFRRVSQKNAIFLGYVDDNMLSSLLFSARCFVIASWFDNLPLAVFEAMAQKTPIISYYKGGHNEYIVQGENGFKFRNLKEARKYIKTVFSNDDLYEHLKIGAINTAMKVHPDKIIPKYISLYKKFSTRI